LFLRHRRSKSVCRVDRRKRYALRYDLLRGRLGM
jgi:hypothetical protein